MTIEELVRDELRSVAEQVPVPPLPTLDDRRRGWRAVVAAAAAVALVIGGLTLLLRREADRPEPPIDNPKVVHVDSSAPTIPWIDGDRLLVGGREVHGRWLEVSSGGDTWLARRADGRVFWGRGTKAHGMGKYIFPLWYDGPYLSPGGRYVAVGYDRGRLVDTETGRSRTVSLPGGPESWIAGVTDEGVVISADGDEGNYAVRPGRAPVRLDSQDGQVVRSNDSGLLLRDGRGGVWVVDVVGTRVRRIAQVITPDADGDADYGHAASVSTDRRWLLDLGWAVDRDEPPTLPVAAVVDGSPAPVSAPRGWVFAPQLAPGFWEPEGTLITFVVRPENREYHAARCAPASGECVLLDES